jgi:hypothetical protein
MWFADLSPYTYLPRHEPTGDSSPPTLNVGWLDEKNPFPTGTLPTEVVERLALLVAHGSTNDTRGFHLCPFCPRPTDPLEYPDLERAHKASAEIRVVDAAGARYAAPTLIHHYVSVHGYWPPPAFVDALMRAAHVEWSVARRDDVCFGCGSPLRRAREDEGWRVQATRRERIKLVVLDCDTCGASYRRIFEL